MYHSCQCECDEAASHGGSSGFFELRKTHVPKAQNLGKIYIHYAAKLWKTNLACNYVEVQLSLFLVEEPISFGTDPCLTPSSTASANLPKSLLAVLMTAIQITHLPLENSFISAIIVR